MAMEIRIDDPADLEIRHPMAKIKGWCAADCPEDLEGWEFRIAGHAVRHRQMLRPDVEEARPGKSVIGFLMELDLSQHLPAVRKRQFVMQVIKADTEPIKLPFRVSGEALGRCLESAAGS
jgi:hypothetical protein